MADTGKIAEVGDASAGAALWRTEENELILSVQLEEKEPIALKLDPDEVKDLFEVGLAAVKDIAGASPLALGQLWGKTVKGEEVTFKVTATDLPDGEFELERVDGPTALRGERGRTTIHPEDNGFELVGEGPP